MQRLVPILIAVAFGMAPLGAAAADLVVWWENGFYSQEDEAVREIIAASSRIVARRSNSFSPIKTR